MKWSNMDNNIFCFRHIKKILKIYFNNDGKFPTDWNIGVIKPITKRKVIEGPQQITEESLWQVVWTNCSHQFYNPGWINISKSTTFSTQNNLDSDQMLEQQIVYSSYNNSFISAANNMKNFMLALLTMKRLLKVYGSLKWHINYKRKE